MSYHPNIGYKWTKFPKQTRHLGKRVRVQFADTPGKTVLGTIVRDDADSPFQTIILLDDNRYVRSGECIYRVIG